MNTVLNKRTGFKLRILNHAGNQAAWHFKLDNPSPSNNWMDTAKRIGYFPRLSKYLKTRELEKDERSLNQRMIDTIQPDMFIGKRRRK